MREQKTIKTAHVTVISPSRGWLPLDLGELWAHRELLYFLVWREVKVRYKQTAFGFAWAVAQPLLMMIIFTLFFGILARIPSGNIPYSLFVLCGLVPWTLFANAISRASNSLIQDPNLISKVYFPRLLLPLASVLSPLLDFIIAYVLLVGLMFYYAYYPGLTMLWMPLFIVLELMLALGIGLWLSAINVEYRDVAFLVPFLLQLGLFASPVIYPSQFVPARFHTMYGILNPMSGIIEGFRWSVVGTAPPSELLLSASALIVVVIFVSGAYYFRRREKSFADFV